MFLLFIIVIYLKDKNCTEIVQFLREGENEFNGLIDIHQSRTYFSYNLISYS